jgi:hypothetical protein
VRLHVLFLDRARIDAPLVSNKIQPHVFDELALGKNSGGPETNPVLGKEFRECRIILLLQLGNLRFYYTKRLLVSGGTRKSPMSKSGTRFRASRLLEDRNYTGIVRPSRLPREKGPAVRFFQSSLRSLPVICYFASFVSQQAPGGIGLPCGQVFGWPRNEQIRWSSSGVMMCSKRQACWWTSASSMAKVSVKRRSARRWRRTTSRARREPASVR